MLSTSQFYLQPSFSNFWKSPDTNRTQFYDKKSLHLQENKIGSYDTKTESDLMHCEICNFNGYTTYLFAVNRLYKHKIFENLCPFFIVLKTFCGM